MTRPDDALDRAYAFAPEAPTRGREPYRDGDDAGRESERLDAAQLAVDHVRRLVATTRAPRLVAARCLEGHSLEVQEGDTVGLCRVCGLGGLVVLPEGASAEEIAGLLVIEIAGHEQNVEHWSRCAADLRAMGGNTRVLDDLIARAAARRQRLVARLEAESEAAE